MVRRLGELDVAFAVTRHITQASVNALLVELDLALKAPPARTPSALAALAERAQDGHPLVTRDGDAGAGPKPEQEGVTHLDIGCDDITTRDAGVQVCVCVCVCV